MLLRLTRFCLLLMGFFLISVLTYSQETIVKGKITDANSGDPLPFVNVVFNKTTIGTTTDFDGNYLIKTTTPTDTLVASYVGYVARKKPVERGRVQVINFTLHEDVTNLAEIVVRAGENPAWEVMRKVVRNKERNDKRQYSYYEYDTYTKIEIDVDNMSEKFRQKKLLRKVTQVLDSVDRIAGEDGKPILPMFISESVSRFYYRASPSMSYEHILKSKMNGVGVQDGTFITQLVGTSFQEYNFYQNWLSILNKEFVSPIADGWRLYYDYDLMDSVYVGDDFCYRLDFYPKSPQELAFTGTIWITKDDYALKQIDATIGKEANLNFIEKIKIQQELEEIDNKGWIPVKNRVLVDVSEITKTSAGMLAKFYTSNKNIVINKPHETRFYQQPIVMAEDARMYEAEEYWDTLRHEPLSATEKSVYKMIDTLTNIPVVRTYTDIIRTAVNGYLDAGKIYIGPYNSFVAVNNIEGFRLMGGVKTSMDFSNKWILRGQLGYGFKDSRVKYSARVDRIFSRKHWTIASLRVRSDIARVGIDEDAIADSYLLYASQRWGYFRRGYYFDEGRFNFQRELFKGFTGRVTARYTTFKPTFPFEYHPELNDASLASNFETSEVAIEARYARDELFLQDDNDRVSMGTDKSPVITLRYTRGFKGIGGSDFDFTKVKASVNKRIKWGPLGYSNIILAAEHVFDPIPYPLLSPHLGNQSFFYTAVTYNLMDYGEFVSDSYVSMNYQHHFEGLFLNRLPLIQKLKWRLVGTANVVYGGLSQQNRDMIVVSTPATEEQIEFTPSYFERGRPYIELGYGVENIFRFLRIDFVHRLSYLDYNNQFTGEERTGARRFGILFTAQFSL